MLPAQPITTKTAGIHIRRDTLRDEILRFAQEDDGWPGTLNAATALRALSFG